MEMSRSVEGSAACSPGKTQVFTD